MEDANEHPPITVDGPFTWFGPRQCAQLARDFAEMGGAHNSRLRVYDRGDSKVLVVAPDQPAAQDGGTCDPINESRNCPPIC